MTWMQRILLLMLGLALLGVTLELIRKRRLREEYAVLWVCTALMLLAFVVMPGLVFQVAAYLNLDHAVLMMLLCFLFLSAIVMHYSVVITKLSDRAKGLSQELALLKDEMSKLRGAERESPPAAPESRPKPPSLRT